MRLNATQFDAQTPEQQALNHPRTKHVHVTLKDQRDKWIAGDEMDDLGDDQMVALSQVFEDHQMEWTRISDEMASINQLLRGFGALSDESTFDSWRTLEQSFSRLEFERREVDMRALRRLSLYLNTDQRKRFPVLQNFDDTSGD